MTDADEKKTAAWVKEFDTFRRVVQEHMGIRDEEVLPLTIVLFANPDDLRALVPEPSRAVRDVLVMAVGLGQQPMIATSLERRSFAAEVKLRTGTVMWLLSSAGVNYDPWILQGCIDFFGGLEFKPDGVRVTRALETHLNRKIRPSKGEEMHRLDLEGLSGDPLLPWAALHYLLVARDGWKGAGPLLAYQRAVMEGADREQAFAAAFGLPLETANAEIRRFLKNGRFKETLIGAVPKSATEAFVLEAIPAGLRECLFAQFMIQMQGADKEQVLAHINRAETLLPDDPRLWETWWVYHMKNNDVGLAREVMAKAVRAGTTHEYLRTQLCIERIDEMLATGGFLCAGATAIEAADTLTDMTRRNPYSRRGYKMMAQFVPSIIPARESDRQVLEAGLRLLPRDDLIRLGLAAWDWRNGDLAGARVRLGEVVLTGETGPIAQAYHRWLAQQLLATETVDRVRTALAAGDFAEVESRLSVLTAGPLHNLPLQTELESQRRQLHHSQLIDRAEQACDAGRLESAEFLLDSFVGDIRSDLLLQRVERVRLKIATAKAAKSSP